MGVANCGLWMGVANCEWKAKWGMSGQKGGGGG